jgi:hypothetical protein
MVDIILVVLLLISIIFFTISFYLLISVWSQPVIEPKSEGQWVEIQGGRYIVWKAKDKS